MSDQISKITEIKRRHEKQWLGIGGVTAIGIGRINNQAGIIISVAGHTDKVRAQIPYEVEGIPVKVQVTGKLRAQ